MSVKQQLFQACIDHVQSRIANASAAIAEAKEAAASETKSSAGDKYETGRAMMQQEIEKHSRQLTESQKLLQVLNAIDHSKTPATAQLGSLVKTSSASYYLAASIGQVVVGGDQYFVVSPGAPVGQALIGKKKGDSFTFGGRTERIEEVA